MLGKDEVCCEAHRNLIGRKYDLLLGAKPRRLTKNSLLVFFIVVFFVSPPGGKKTAFFPKKKAESTGGLVFLLSLQKKDDLFNKRNAEQGKFRAGSAIFLQMPLFKV